MSNEDHPAPEPSPRIVLLSIAVFWALYFTIWSLRATVVYHSGHTMLLARALVSAGSAGVTVLFYLAMRRWGTTKLGRSMIIAALLSVPAALAYATINWFFMERTHEKQMAQPASPAPVSHHSTVIIEDDKGETVMIAPPAPPAPPPPVSVGQMTDAEDSTPLTDIVDQAGNGYFFFIAWAAIYLSLCYAARMGALERRTAELRAAAQSAELRALRYQVNPHFLFNTLNSLSSLVMTGKKEEAERMIINLSTFFRTSLTGDPTEDVPLSEEILLQRLYLDIETVRFPERLVTKIEVPELLEKACVPGLILQPIVENAVKYGVSRARRPVTIRIRASAEAENLLLSVEDDGDPAGDAAGGTGVGLRNVRDRLAARFGDTAHCHWGPRAGGGFVVRLTMPLVRHGC
ncbi:histidine kinase [Sphingomonas sp. CGMCC 1.13654]|uniref:Histidine kinase n=2 Tax=Sphingomonas chungangi TaxID=2683589 RepID=A0A838L835_9SPHN|nr:histidine kinase [Sphingomonas chungangi]MVW57337.1 sensor histidine kinase [Sphingomonas chungangi]